MKLELIIPVLAVRKEASHRSELLNQILFGETIDIIEEKDDWAFINTCHDNYRGWIENKSFYFEKRPQTNLKKIIASFSAKILSSQTTIHIPFGSFINEATDKLLEGLCIDKSDLDNTLDLICSQLIGSPYLWGGRTGFGIDCSGLTQLFYRFMNISIPRDAHLQAREGDDIFLSQAGPGDLLFYKNSDNKIVHVGIAIDSKHILHASGTTRLDEYDEKGIRIYNSNNYTHSFAMAKRIIRHG